VPTLLKVLLQVSPRAIKLHFLPSTFNLFMTRRAEGDLKWNACCATRIRPSMINLENPSNWLTVNHQHLSVECNKAYYGMISSLISDKHLFNCQITVTGLDLLAITETWLNDDIGDVCPAGYSAIHQPWISGRGREVALFFRDLIMWGAKPTPVSWDAV
jgi:hypothetical protein